MWTIIALGALIAELLFAVYYMLAVALGLGAAGVTAAYTPSLVLQLIAGGVVMAIGLYLCHRIRRKERRAEPPASSNPNVNMDIGQTLSIEWASTGESRASYRGASWVVKARSSEPQASGMFRIVEVDGSTLIVDAIPTPDPQFSDR